MVVFISFVCSINVFLSRPRRIRLCPAFGPTATLCSASLQSQRVSHFSPLQPSSAEFGPERQKTFPERLEPKVLRIGGGSPAWGPPFGFGALLVHPRNGRSIFHPCTYNGFLEAIWRPPKGQRKGRSRLSSQYVFAPKTLSADHEYGASSS